MSRNSFRRNAQWSRAGYWISPVGGFIEIMEHFEHIRAHPEDFGYTRAQTRKWTRRDRAKILREAMESGWVRVRYDKQGVGHYEFWRLDEWTHAQVVAHLDAMRIPDNAPVILSELSRNRYDEMPAGDVREMSLAFMANPEDAYE